MRPAHSGRRNANTAGLGRHGRGLAVLVVAIGGSGALIWQASYAAFTSTTTNGTNAWTAGSVSITNDQSASAVFSATGVKPDASLSTLAPSSTGAFAATSTASGGSACIKVTYTGSLAATVKLYATLTETGANGGLGQYLLFDVDTGTDTATGSDTSCSTFTSNSTYVFGSNSNSSTNLSTFPATYAAQTVSGWTNATNPSTLWYRFSWLLPSTVSSNAQSQEVQAVFTWQADNN